VFEVWRGKQQQKKHEVVIGDFLAHGGEGLRNNAGKRVRGALATLSCNPRGNAVL